MYHAIQKALLKGDYLKAAQLCQEALDAATTTPPLGPLLSDANTLLAALERCTLGEDYDQHLWHLIQDLDPLVKGHLSCVPDADLVAALDSPKDALADLFDDDDLWDAMTANGQEKKAREFIRDDVDVSGLRRLLHTLEG